MKSARFFTSPPPPPPKKKKKKKKKTTGHLHPTGGLFQWYRVQRMCDCRSRRRPFPRARLPVGLSHVVLLRPVTRAHVRFVQKLPRGFPRVIDCLSFLDLPPPPPPQPPPRPGTGARRVFLDHASPRMHARFVLDIRTPSRCSSIRRHAPANLQVAVFTTHCVSSASDASRRSSLCKSRVSSRLPDALRRPGFLVCQLARPTGRCEKRSPHRPPRKLPRRRRGMNRPAQSLPRLLVVREVVSGLFCASYGFVGGVQSLLQKNLTPRPLASRPACRRLTCGASSAAAGRRKGEPISPLPLV